ncbi:VWA domain-containing protein [Rhodobacteraceae bacterium CCMM004]|nr:VWA domain-containing protein [Rhodobacteraceae bacterium CCMM004]
MSSDDPLDHLSRALRDAAPDPDPQRRAATLAQAQENFARAQAAGAGMRPISDRRPWRAATMRGVKRMTSLLTTRGGLAATTALVAAGLVLTLPDLRTAVLPGGDAVMTTETQENALRPKLERSVAEEAVMDAEAPMALPAPPPSASLTRLADHSDTAGAPSGSVQFFPPSPAEPPAVAMPESDTEVFANADTNPLRIAAEAPISTFSVDVDTASYGVVRASLAAGRLPPSEAVRVEEMVNYFPYAYAPPAPGEGPFAAHVALAETPWNPDTLLLRIALQGEMPAVEDRPPLNLVFLIDTSGSMQDPAKLPLLKQAFRMMLPELRPEDEVAIVTYAGSAGEVLSPTPAGDRRTILAALDRLEAGGSTAGQAGLIQAYATAEAMAENGEVGRVLLATDGDFNVGLSDPGALEDFIADKRDSGVYLSVLGFGRGNLDDATMQALAQSGNGLAAYIDTAAEARKVLVDQLTGALFAIAEDVKVQVEFNPAQVAEYRLIGYETRALRREDFNNDRVDAGEIGAGHSVTALYEVVPVGSPARLTEPLRFGADDRAGPAEGPLALVRLRHKAPRGAESSLREIEVAPDPAPADAEFRFAAAIAGWGQILRGGEYVGDWTVADAADLARGALGDDPFGYRREAITLMQLSESLER